MSTSPGCTSSLKLSTESPSKSVHFPGFFVWFGFGSFKGLIILLAWKVQTPPSPSPTCPIPFSWLFFIPWVQTHGTFDQRYTSLLTGASAPGPFPFQSHLNNCPKIVIFLLYSMIASHCLNSDTCEGIRTIHFGSSQFLTTSASPLTLTSTNRAMPSALPSSCKLCTLLPFYLQFSSFCLGFPSLPSEILPIPIFKAIISQ